MTTVTIVDTPPKEPLIATKIGKEVKMKMPMSWGVSLATLLGCISSEGHVSLSRRHHTRDLYMALYKIGIISQNIKNAMAKLDKKVTDGALSFGKRSENRRIQYRSPAHRVYRVGDDRFAIVMTEDQAKTLMELVLRVGGDATKSRRKHIDEIRGGLLRHKIERADLKEQPDGTIYFLDEENIDG